MTTKTAISGGFRCVGEILGSRWKSILGRSSGVCVQVPLGRSVGMGLLRAPVMPKQAFLAWETIPGPCRCNVAEIHIFDAPKQSPSIINRKNTHQKKKSEKISDPRPTPKPATSTNAAAHNSPFCARCDLRPNAPKANKKNRHVHRGIRTRNRQHTYMLVPRPLPPPSMLVLAGQNRKWALSVLFVYNRFFSVANQFSAVPRL